VARAPSHRAASETGDDARLPPAMVEARTSMVIGVILRFPHNLMVISELVAPASLRLRSGQARRLSGRHLAFLLIAFLLASSFSTSVAAKKRSSTLSAPDPEYTPALAAANRFLQAWQNQDHETGLLMLTDIAKQNSSQDRMELFFSSGRDAAYEIARGKKLKAGRYAFPVALFAFRSDANKPCRPQRSEIVVVRAGRDEWAIDKLP
jgi:hypothetical protein